MNHVRDAPSRCMTPDENRDPMTLGHQTSQNIGTDKPRGTGQKYVQSVTGTRLSLLPWYLTIQVDSKFPLLNRGTV